MAGGRVRCGASRGHTVKTNICLAAVLGLVWASALAHGAAGDISMTPVSGGTLYAGSSYSLDVFLSTGTTQPDTIQFDLAFDTGKLYLPFSTVSGGIPPTFSNPKIVMGPNQGTLGLSVNHDPADPGFIRVVRGGGSNEPANISGTFKLFTVTFTATTIGTSQVTGTVSVLRDASLQQIGTPQVLPAQVTAQGRATVYVNFGAGGSQTGEQANPFSTLEQAVNGVLSGGAVIIAPGDTSETLRITKAMTLSASGYRVRLGLSGAKLLEDAAAFAETSGDGSASGDRLDWSAFLASLAWSRTALSSGTDAEAATEPLIHEKALPKPGSLVPGADQVFALRLRGDGTGIGASLQTAIAGPGLDGAALEVLRVAPDDVWVLYRGGAHLQPGDALTLSAQAPGVPPASHTFVIAEAAAPLGAPLTQPGYEHFDSSGIDLNSEDASQHLVYTASVPGLDGGIDLPCAVAPSRVFDTPQRIWIGLPDGVAPGALDLYYYHEDDGQGAWYPADRVAGWLVPGSELQLELDGRTYYGFTVRHGGILQLRAQTGE